MMARLRDLKEYLEDRGRVLDRAEAGLERLQQKYETFFSEVAAVRETELRQVIDLTVTDSRALPAWYNEGIDRAEREVTADLDQQVRSLADRAEVLREEAEAVREASREADERIRGRNARLDQEEETLKNRTAVLLEEIDRYNRRIKSLGSGFGFFWNFFSMRPLAREKERLVREHGDVAARIENLRTRWSHEEAEFTSREADRRERWIELERRAAEMEARVEALETRRSEIVVRSSVERVLESRRPALDAPVDGDPNCPRCNMAHRPEQHFCHICAHRLAADRPDFEGSVEEMAELNLHFERFSRGMESSQEIIGLVRGLGSGVESLIGSVEDVQTSEDKYPLPKLEIDVPPAGREYGRQFDRLAQFTNQDYSLHPTIFADRFDEHFGQVFAEDRITAFFETIGEELSRQAEAQW